MTIKKLLYKNKKQFMIYVFGVLLTTPTNLMVTFGMAHAFTLFEVDTIDQIAMVIFVSLSLAIIPIFLQLLSRYLRIGFMKDILIEVRTMAYDKFLATTPDHFRAVSKEKFQAELTSDINLFEADFFLSILNIVYSLGSFTLGFIVLFHISSLIAFASLSIALLFFALSKAYEKPSKKRKKAIQIQNAMYHRALSNVLRGLETIKLSRVETTFKEKFYTDVNDLEKVKKNNLLLNEGQSNLMQWLGSTIQIISYVYSAYLFSQGLILLPQMVVVLNLVGQLSWTLNSGFSFINRLKTSIEVYERITKVDSLPKARNKFTLTQEITLEDLSFAYDDTLILDNLSLNIIKNNKVLIYGPSGTGKTTLLDCISKNITRYDGVIKYDNQNLHTLSNPSYWEHVAYARQEHFIFNDSIENNILLNKNYDELKFTTIMEALSLNEWLSTLPEHRKHILINNGNNVSGGQRQRISLARELYQDKDVIFFDELSASLDDETARKVYEHILSLNKTIICVSHRHLDFLEKYFDQTINLEKEVIRHA